MGTRSLAADRARAMLAHRSVASPLLISSCLGGTFKQGDHFKADRRSNNIRIVDGGMMMGLGKRTPGVPLLLEFGKNSGYMSGGGMSRALGKRRQNFISDGGMMMGLGKRKRSSGQHSITDGGMLMGLGKRAPSISDGGMMMGLGKRVPSISDGGMMLGLGKRASNNYITDGGMMMGLGKRSADNYITEDYTDFIKRAPSIVDGGMLMGLGKRSGRDYDDGKFYVEEDRNVY